MPYIYKIVNNLNQKIYIGKTNRSIEERFKEHIRKANQNTDRPLYRAIRKYGIENFTINQIEECSLEQTEEREKYWIEYYQSFKYGYNATLGGDGKTYIDRDVVIKNYEILQEQKLVAQKMGISEKSVHNILIEQKIPIKTSSQIIKKKYGTPVSMFDLQGNFIQTFSSYSEASQWLIDNKKTNCKLDTMRTHISAVCNGKRKTAAGYIWKK